MFISFESIPACDGRTDGQQTGTPPIIINIEIVHEVQSLKRDKKDAEVENPAFYTQAQRKK